MVKPWKLWVLFDQNRELFSVYTSRREAEEDAVGPRFRDGFEAVAYVRTTECSAKRKKLPKRVKR